jgi:hypothetical protein
MSDDKLKSLLENKLAEAFAKLLPEEISKFIPIECWQESIKLSVDKFFDHKDPSQTERQSRFEHVVWSVLQEKTKEQLVKYFESPEWTGRWGGSTELGSIPTIDRNGYTSSKSFAGFGTMASEAVQKLVKENMESIITTLVGGQIQSVIDSMRYQIQRDIKQ